MTIIIDAKQYTVVVRQVERHDCNILLFFFTLYFSVLTVLSLTVGKVCL